MKSRMPNTAAFIEATNRPTPRGHNGEETWLDETLNGDTQPVVGVTWFDAQAFAEWIGGSLPTEAQWERAARGTSARTYPWGDTPPKARQHANFARRYNRPVSVGQFLKGESPDGIADLAGNVWEWCLDEYSPTAYQRGSSDVSRNPLNLRFRDVLRARVIRGGAWDVGRAFLRSGLRFKFYPLDSTHTIRVSGRPSPLGNKRIACLSLCSNPNTICPACCPSSFFSFRTSAVLNRISAM